MMGYGNFGPMWGGGSIFGLFFILTWLVWLAVGVLLVIWLWKKIKQ